jgi:phage terminase small subunit
VRGRKRTPTKILEIRGAFRRNPQRKKDREGEPEPTLGVGKPPSYLGPEARARWRELATLGQIWLTQAERPKLEETAKLWAKSRRNELTTADGKRYDKLLGDLGFDPVARTRIKTPSQSKPDAKRKRFFGT